MQMPCCCERVGPIRRCFAVSMVFVLGRMLPPVFSPPPMQMLCCCECVGPIRGCFCRVGGLVWANALPSEVSSGCFVAVITYDFTSLLATIGLSSFVLGSVSWSCQVEGPPMFLDFCLCCGLRW
jgi:hypothetical protein